MSVSTVNAWSEWSGWSGVASITVEALAFRCLPLPSCTTGHR